MNMRVPQMHESQPSDSLAARSLLVTRTGHNTLRAGIVLLGTLCALIFATNALGAAATVGLGTSASFSVLAGSTVTNTGPTTMFGDLGLSPGSSVTGAPVVLGQTHIADAVAIGAKNDLTTAYNDAAGREMNGSAGTDLAGQTFTAGVYKASGALLLSSGSVTLDAQGNPEAVFIFQVGSTLITEPNTTVLLTNGAQACNVFWQVGSSATLGTGTKFVGTVMASATITAATAATIHGRLLAQTGAVNLDTNTITTSNCAAGKGGGGGTETPPTETTPPSGGGTPAGAGAPAATVVPPVASGAGTSTAGAPTATPTPAVLPVASRTTLSSKQIAARKAANRRAARKAAARRAARRAAARRRNTRRVSARPPLQHPHSGFTG